jgi:hypothetical protein
LGHFQEANIELTKRGYSIITISMALPREHGTGEQQNPGLKKYLDLVHLNKILRSDAIFVVGEYPDKKSTVPYIGESTAREILWASMHGKPLLTYMSTPFSWDAEVYDMKYRLYNDSVPQMAKKSAELLVAAKKAIGLL